MAGVMLVTVDGLCVTVVALTCGQLELLRKEIGYLEQTARANVAARTAPGRPVSEGRVELEKERLLATYSETHKKILNFLCLLEQPLKFVAFINSWILTICLVTTAFEILNVKGLSIPRLIAIGVYLQTSISFVFVYCFIGDKLIEEQEKVRHELYKTEWTFSSKKYKYTLGFMLLRAQVPSTVTVGKLAVLNLETYIDELNRAFTVFNAMLQLRQS
nr:odorant receptor [Odontothrips loti]